MARTRYVALLRGINVGGRNPVRMADLREAFDAAGHEDVKTYIQSGNVLFTSTAGREAVERDLEAMLEARYGVPLVVVVRSHRQLRAVVEKAPEGFGQEPDTYHSDVIFLRSPLTPRKAMAVVREREGVDRCWPGTGVLYFSRVSALRTKSKMSSIVGTPEYQLMTIRSWSTTAKLLTLLDEQAAG
ncbi:MAG TPA: DUF1697 domain-containing protein [Aquihabitans sp.]|jgi:uncharacterized protein (DUF1697 family)|nr:DUF1697 domain-containing protein [Aquihabitans sp.]